MGSFEKDGISQINKLPLAICLQEGLFVFYKTANPPFKKRGGALFKGFVYVAGLPGKRLEGRTACVESAEFAAMADEAIGCGEQ
ncbi:hypothetical protein BpJC7_08050 [Weizmannia acidilactici]|uniref:Uncharacterized protein n=1 Tax=Weizmannia acidilactici TaxID=2607726 RepID=A0A5J4J3D1_9BACI|nr:hypothetical protein [Weizmannia acidilactici]GER66352.1 hypothetical protein BpJC4_08230 [Weizmannia acidilactici]GER69502.1 hypothetical protein BpJC7_08050 [Weizmannia acidilactici]GER73039.1 hypothetical protein BpPP18_11060 [Weizmannia acidilactici]